MTSRATFLKNLLFIAGGALLLYALYQMYLLATGLSCVVGGDRAGCYLNITFSFGNVIVDSILEGLFFYAAVGLLLVSLSADQARRAYWGLQLAVWFGGLMLWFKAGHHFDPFPVDTWTWLIVTAACSLVLFALRSPLMHLLNGVFGASERPA